VIWKVFRRTPSKSQDDAAWWHAARTAEASPTTAAIAGLRARLASQEKAPDAWERQVEMIDGLEQVAAMAGAEPATIETQHRVVGTDVCHFVVPACLVGLTDQPGKLFLTSRRLIHVGGTVRAWPWHRIGGVDRDERALEVTIIGTTDTINLICNTYGDAMAAAHLARRLQR
jgi:hypothetical protein